MQASEASLKTRSVAVLLTVHNRRAKTIACLDSLYRASLPAGWCLKVYLVDDGCTDGTAEAVRTGFPGVTVIHGDGNLYWAGGMRLVWRTAMKEAGYDAFLLINDDVVLAEDFLIRIEETEAYSMAKHAREGLYIGATCDSQTGRVTYGGVKIINSHFFLRMRKVLPGGGPVECDIANANICYVGAAIVRELGIYDDRFTHGIADFDYSLSARERKIPVLLAPGFCGSCSFDHNKGWDAGGRNLRGRVRYLYSPKGLACREYLYYIRKHFPLYLPCAFAMLWVRTLFPRLWGWLDRMKKFSMHAQTE